MSYISEMRKFVGHAPIMAVAAMGILYNEEKGLLLEKRTDTGEWCTPGGAIELGESLEDALKREIKEETNLEFRYPKLFDIKANVEVKVNAAFTNKVLSYIAPALGLENVPEYKFSFKFLVITLIAFIIVYELVMYLYSSISTIFSVFII